MIISRTLMGVGECRLELRRSSRYRRLMANPSGYLVVFDTDPKTPSLDRARHAFKVTRIDGNVVVGEGLATLLANHNGVGVHKTNTTTYAAQTLPNWWATLFPVNSLTVGATSGVGLSSWGGTWPVGMSLREFLAEVCRGVGGAEWRINPNGTVDVAGEGELFRDGEVVFSPQVSLSGGSPRGIYGRVTGRVASKEQTATRVLVAGQGDGDQMLVVTASTGVFDYGLDGSGLELTAVVDAPQQDTAGATAVASLQAGLRAQQRVAFDVETDDLDIWRRTQEGDRVWVFDPESGVEDRSQFVPFEGRVISPQSVRVHTMTGSVSSECSVFWLHDQTNSWADLTADVVWAGTPVLLRCGSGQGPVDYAGGGTGPWLGTDPQVVRPSHIAGDNDAKERRAGRVASSRDRRVTE